MMIINDNGNNDETDQEQMRFFAHLVYQLQMTSSKSNTDKNTFIFTVHEEEVPIIHIHIHTYIYMYVYQMFATTLIQSFSLFIVHRPY